MSYFEFPHTRSYDGDLGYIIKKLDELNTKYDNFFEYNSIRFHDPIEWDIAESYPAFNIVFDEQSETLYISKTAVPAGIDISNGDYWLLVSPFKVDTELSDTSINPIANKTVKANIDALKELIDNIDVNVDAVTQALEAEATTRAAEDAALDSRINSANNELITEIHDRQNADAVLSARIDEFEQLTDGSTTGDAELADIRVAGNGKTYPTAGDAVRAQYTTNNNTLKDYVGVTAGYLFNEKAYIATNIEVGSTVDLTPISNNLLDYIIINVTYGDTLYITGNGANAARLCSFIDSDNKMLWKSSGTASWIGMRVNTPQNAAKAIINCRRDASYDLVLIKHNSPLYKSVMSSTNVTINAQNYSALNITDADTIEANTAYGIASNITENMVANLPDYGTSAMLYSITAITPSDTNPSGVVTVQFFITTNALAFYYRTKAGADFTPWFSVTNSDSYDLSSYFVNTCVQKPFTIDSTKRCILFGDSITTRTGSDDPADPHYWLKDLATMTGCEWTTYGVGSSAFTDTGDPDQRGGQIITQIESDSVNWDADIVFVAAGTNDAGFGYKLDEDTVLNALETDVQECIDTIKEKLEAAGRSDAKIVFITPIRRGGSTAKKVAIRAFLPKVCAKIANIALLNKISVINGFDFPITVESTDYYDAMTNYDELHPNNAGKWVYAMSVLNALL